MESLSPIALGFLGSLIAGLMTAVGAIPVLLGKTPSRRVRDMSLGFAAGVMLSASFFSLIIPSLEAASQQFGDGAIPASISVVGILAGMAVVAWLNEVLPHEHFATGREGPESAALRQIWLFIIAITIHNFPEGLAVGVGFGANGLPGGLPLAIGIGLQNLPESNSILRRSISGLAKVVPAFLRRVEVADFAEGVEEAGEGSCTDATEVGFQFGERHFYRVQVRTVRRQEQEPTAVCAQSCLSFFVSMGGEVVEDHDGARFDLGDQHIADVGDKGGTVHCAFDDPWCDQIGWPQSSDQGLGSP